LHWANFPRYILVYLLYARSQVISFFAFFKKMANFADKIKSKKNEVGRK
jgi:hypothetical protein